AFHPGDESLDLGGERSIHLKYRRVENDREHAIREAAGVRGITAPASGQRSCEDLAEHCQSVTLVAGDGKDGTWWVCVKSIRVGGGLTGSVDDATLRYGDAAVQGHADLSCGDRAGRHVEDDRRQT